jgi:hypothetical protein
MTTAQIEALTRNILQHPRLPFTFQSLSAEADAWHIVVSDDSGTTHQLTVPKGRPIEIRRAIEERLEIAIEDATLR